MTIILKLTCICYECIDMFTLIFIVVLQRILGDKLQKEFNIVIIIDNLALNLKFDFLI